MTLVAASSGALRSVDGEDVHLGRQVELSAPTPDGRQAGRLRYLSVSALKLFDALADGGCERKYHFRYVQGVKEPDRGPGDRAKGREAAAKFEHYFKTGELVLPPELLPGLRVLPARGPDLEVEAPLGDAIRAIRLRDSLDRVPVDLRPRVISEVRRAAGLAAGASCVPLVGARDLHHARGEWVDQDGEVRREARERGRVAETIDHKTSSDPEKWGLSGQAILDDVQFLGYGVADFTTDPVLDHARLSPVYYATRGSRRAVKRTILVSRREALDRWASHFDPVVDRLEQVLAAGLKVTELPPNLSSCDKFGGCPYRAQCPLTSEQVAVHLLGDPPANPLKEIDQMNGTGSLFDQLAAPGTLPAPPPPPAPVAPAPVTPLTVVLTDADRLALLVELERGPVSTGVAGASRFQALSYGGYCKVEGTAWSITDAGRWYLAKFRGAPPAPPAPSVAPPAPPAPSVASPVASPVLAPGQVLPPDAPRAADDLAQARPLSPEARAEIQDPALRAKLEDHARRAGERAAAEAQASKKLGGRCPGSGQAVALDVASAARRKIRCPSCGQDRPVPKDLPAAGADGVTRVPFPGHNLPKEGLTLVVPVVDAGVDSKVEEGARQTEGYAGVSYQGPVREETASSVRVEVDVTAAIADDLRGGRGALLEELAVAVEAWRRAEERILDLQRRLREVGYEDDEG